MGRRHSDNMPEMRRHKRSGQARVRIHGREYICGPWGSAEARVEYQRLVAAWLQAKTGDSDPSAVTPPPTKAEAATAPPPAVVQQLPHDLTVGEVALRWIEDIERTIPDYRKNSKWGAALTAAAALNELRSMPAKDFGPRALLHVQRRLVETPACQRPAKKGEPLKPPKMRSRRYVNDIV